MNPLIKVDRVSTVEEALELEKRGADILGIFLQDHYCFSDNRRVTEDVLEKICSSLEKAQVCLHLGESDLQDKKTVEIIKKYNISYIQVMETESSGTVYDLLNRLDVKKFIAGIDADYDWDPSWIIPEDRGLSQSGRSVSFQLELATGVHDSWNFLKDECPRYEENLQIDDIGCLGLEHNIFISLDFTPQNIKEIFARLHTISGITLNLGTLKAGNFPAHCFDYDQVLTILDAL